MALLSPLSLSFIYFVVVQGRVSIIFMAPLVVDEKYFSEEWLLNFNSNGSNEIQPLVLHLSCFISPRSHFYHTCFTLRL
jgi:hypothetical protein